MKKKYPNKAELQELRDQGLTRLEIAEKFNVSVSSVKDWLSVMGIAKKFEPKSKDNTTDSSKNSELIRLHPEALPFDEGLPLMEKAQLRLGSRMACRGGDYYLDGRISTPRAILRLCGLD